MLVLCVFSLAGGLLFGVALHAQSNARPSGQPVMASPSPGASQEELVNPTQGEASESHLPVCSVAAGQPAAAGIPVIASRAPRSASICGKLSGP